MLEGQEGFKSERDFLLNAAPIWFRIGVYVISIFAYINIIMSVLTHYQTGQFLPMILQGIFASFIYQIHRKRRFGFAIFFIFYAGYGLFVSAFDVLGSPTLSAWFVIGTAYWTLYMLGIKEYQKRVKPDDE